MFLPVFREKIFTDNLKKSFIANSKIILFKFREVLGRLLINMTNSRKFVKKILILLFSELDFKFGGIFICSYVIV